MLYAGMEAQETVVMLTIRHHRQLSFDFVRLCRWHHRRMDEPKSSRIEHRP